MKTQIPVGATWRFQAPNNCGIFSGATGSVWLEERREGMEVWRWEWSYADGSGRRSDWASTRRKVTEECSLRFGGRCKVRFQRVKG